MLSIARNKKPYSKLLNNTKLVRRFPSWLIQEHSNDPEQPAFLPSFCFTILSILVLLSEWFLPWMQDIYSSSSVFLFISKETFLEHPEQPFFQN